MRAVVVAGSGDRVPVDLAGADMVIAADSGYLRVGKAADIAVGDFDSLGYIPDAPEVFALPAEKDDTDTAKAAEIALERGADEIVFYGVLGGRLDHTLANLQLCSGLAAQGADTAMVGEGLKIFFVANGEREIKACKGAAVSVFSFGRSEGVSLCGLKYPLENAVLKDDFPLGVSNEMAGETARVAVKKGVLAVFVYEKSCDIRS